jgi:hypothetical protein
LNPTIVVESAVSPGMPFENGTVGGRSPSPLESNDGTIEYMTASWCP